MSVGFPSGPTFGPKVASKFAVRAAPKFAPKPPSKFAPPPGRKIGYVPGSMYKRMQLTTGQKMNRRVVAAQVDRIALSGSLVFSAQIDRSYRHAALVLQQAARTQMQHFLDARA